MADPSYTLFSMTNVGLRYSTYQHNFSQLAGTAAKESRKKNCHAGLWLATFSIASLVRWVGVGRAVHAARFFMPLSFYG